ncbi:MAG: hypothetical protein HOW73_03915 [Polyangiaceae bacterium]|nr:hypothetical protein [Polyangiaceae bacterium]
MSGAHGAGRRAGATRGRRFPLSTGFAIGAFCAAIPRAAAAAPPPSGANTNTTAPANLAPGEKRPIPDYDGRPDTTTTAEDALWIPRVLLFPAYVVTEYVVRLPLEFVLGSLEREGVISDLLRTRSDIGALPTAFIDFGFRPSIGIYFYWNNFIAPGNDLRATVAFGGLDFWRGSLANRLPLTSPVGTERARSYFQVEADFVTRSDLLYWGVGPDTPDSAKSAFGLFSVGGGGRIHIEPWRGNFMESWATGRYTTTTSGHCDDGESVVTENLIARVCHPPTIRRQILDGVFPWPAHFGRPYTTFKTGLRFVLDSREERPAPGSGVALDVSVEKVTELKQPDVGGWFNYGAVAAGFFDLTGTQRVLSVALAARFQDALSEDTVVPFTELVGAKHIEDVPDLELMRGFKPGRLLGSSAIAATVEYRWPLWAFLDGTLQASVGNAFAEAHLEDFRPDKLRFSFVGGVRTPNHRDHSFNLLVGFGTNTFEQGGEASSVRFLLGGTTGF